MTRPKSIKHCHDYCQTVPTVLICGSCHRECDKQTHKDCPTFTITWEIMICVVGHKESDKQTHKDCLYFRVTWTTHWSFIQYNITFQPWLKICKPLFKLTEILKTVRTSHQHLIGTIRAEAGIY